MVDKPCRTTHTVISPNRWHFSGKEDQSLSLIHIFIDDRDIVTANVKLIIICVVPFAALYKWMWAYEDPTFVIIAAVIVAVDVYKRQRQTRC